MSYVPNPGGVPTILDNVGLKNSEPRRGYMKIVVPDPPEASFRRKIGSFNRHIWPQISGLSSVFIPNTIDLGVLVKNRCKTSQTVSFNIIFGIKIVFKMKSIFL
jgi:hypothetical protein